MGSAGGSWGKPVTTGLRDKSWRRKGHLPHHGPGGQWGAVGTAVRAGSIQPASRASVCSSVQWDCAAPPGESPALCCMDGFMLTAPSPSLGSGAEWEQVSLQGSLPGNSVRETCFPRNWQETLLLNFKSMGNLSTEVYILTLFWTLNLEDLWQITTNSQI